MNSILCPVAAKEMGYKPLLTRCELVVLSYVKGTRQHLSDIDGRESLEMWGCRSASEATFWLVNEINTVSCSAI